MATVEMVMPKMGESIMEGTILSWLKKEGDQIVISIIIALSSIPEFTSIILGKESNTEPVGIEEKRFYSPLVQSIANQENVNS